MDPIRLFRLTATLVLALYPWHEIRCAPTVRFSAACQEGRSYRIVAVGDLLLHAALQKQAADVGSFAGLWQHWIPWFQQAHIAYLNLEGPTASGVNVHGQDVPDPGPVFDQVVYTNYPRFNYPPRLLDDLTASGFDVVSTGNNHALDRGALGINRTIMALEKAGLQFSGSRRSDLEENPPPWQAMVQRDGLTTAWISCTYASNGIADHKKQLLYCFKQQEEIKQLVTDLKNRVDLIVLTPHWGEENSSTPQPEQIAFAREMLESGATIILGSHPHTQQPMTKHLTQDGRETLIVYSLGNFVNGQRGSAQKSSMILLLDLVKTPSGVALQRVGFMPAFMTRVADAWTLLPLREGENHSGLTHLLKVLPAGNLVFPGQEMALGHPVTDCPP